MMSCTKEYDCNDSQISPVFVNYSDSEIDTLILRKYENNSNFQTLIDTLIITPRINSGNPIGNNGIYLSQNDSTTVLINFPLGIKVGYDWQLFIPATHKVIKISDILSERNHGKRSTGIFRIFSLDARPPCTNEIYSCKVDGRLIDFTGKKYYENYSIFISN